MHTNFKQKFFFINVPKIHIPLMTWRSMKIKITYPCAYFDFIKKLNFDDCILEDFLNLFKLRTYLNDANSFDGL